MASGKHNTWSNGNQDKLAIEINLEIGNLSKKSGILDTSITNQLQELK